MLSLTPLSHLSSLASSALVTFCVVCYKNILIILFTKTNWIIDQDTVFICNSTFKISGLKCFKAKSRGQEMSWQHKKHAGNGKVLSC